MPYFSGLELLRGYRGRRHLVALLWALGVITPSHSGIELPGLAHQVRKDSLAHRQRGGKGRSTVGFTRTPCSVTRPTGTALDFKAVLC